MRRRWPLLIGIVALALVWWRWGDLARLLQAGSVAETIAYLRGFGIWTPLASLVLMVLQAVIAPLPGSLVAAANGALYGVWWGTLLSWAGGLAGAVVSYGLGRWLGERVPRRWRAAPPLRRLDALGASEGFWVVLVARLTPIISLDAIGYLAGMYRMPFGAYMLANAIGMAPGMFAYTWLGADLAAAQAVNWRLALLALAGVALIQFGRWWLGRRQPLR